MANRLLKDLAQNARNRLINRNGGNLKSRKLYNPNVKFKIISNDDKEFNEKASTLSEEDMLAPLGKLINHDYFSKLSEVNKERYLWEMVDKYRKFRDKVQFNEERKVLS